MQGDSHGWQWSQIPPLPRACRDPHSPEGSEYLACQKKSPERNPRPDSVILTAKTQIPGKYSKKQKKIDKARFSFLIFFFF
jgi:hypothetical protein